MKLFCECIFIAILLRVSRNIIHYWSLHNTDHSHPNLKLAMRAFSRKNKIWSNFSPDRAARWSVAVNPPMEKRRSILSPGSVSSSYFFPNLQITKKLLLAYDAYLMHRWCTDDALMMHWWCTGDVLMNRWLSADDAQIMPWWCADDALTMHWWCAGDALMMYWWCTDDALVMRWWCTEDALMIHCWCIYDALLIHWRCTDDALMMHWWCTDDALMMHKCHIWYLWVLFFPKI